MTQDLETVIAIPPIPFRAHRVDLEAHRRNMRFLIERNYLSGGRRRAIGIAGTSLVHHVDADTLLDVLRVTGETVGGAAVLIAGVTATPPRAARAFVEACTRLKRAPDYFLLMPVPGVCNPDGISSEFESIAEEFGTLTGSRFLLYLRSRELASHYGQLMTRSRHIVGIKVGTIEQDIPGFLHLLDSGKEVLWGVGDRATEAARSGARGHTSGITLICPRACDEIHNAYRSGDFERSKELEEIIAELEEVRFMEGRAYNYSAVVATAQLAGFDDVDLGTGGPFNAPPPAPILSRLSRCAEKLKAFH